MSTARATPPPHVGALRKRIENLAAGNQPRANILVRTVATVAVEQLLPPAAVKGGTAMKLRMGVDGSRFSTDLDVARRARARTKPRSLPVSSAARRPSSRTEDDKRG